MSDFHRMNPPVSNLNEYLSSNIHLQVAHIPKKIYSFNNSLHISEFISNPDINLFDFQTTDFDVDVVEAESEFFIIDRNDDADMEIRIELK